MSLIAGRGCRWPPRRDSVSPVRTVVGGGGRDTHDGHENSPILVFFSNLLERKKLSENDPQRDLRTPDGRKIQGARRALPGDAPEDFPRWVHDNTGENPLAWQASARDLLDAAKAVKGNTYDLGDGLMHSLTAVQAMLLGMALECLLKGMYIKRHRVWDEPDKAHAIARGGKYVGVDGAGDHQLVQLAEAAAARVNDQERTTLARLTNFVLYAGRYPIPMRVQNMRPVKTRDGHTVAPDFISGGELAAAEALADRFMDELNP